MGNGESDNYQLYDIKIL